MNVWQRWLQRPQGLWLRRTIFQIHLWTGMAIGLYIAMLSVTGSALVYRTQLNRAFATPTPVFDPSLEVLSEEQLTEAAGQAYPDYTVARVSTRISQRRPAMEVVLERGAERKDRLFNPYTGEDLGDAVPWGIHALNWVASLHDDLLLGYTGRQINGIGSIVVSLLVLTGAVVWWPGTKNWRRSLGVKWSAGWTRLNWDLHSALGFWFFGAIALWAVSGIYLAFPEPFLVIIDSVSDPQANIGERPGDVVLEWMTRLHFGRFRNMPALQAIWVVAGLVPAAMFVTGALMWWNRKFRKRSAH